MISKIINSIEENVSGGSAGGGHVIENQSGTDMTQRANLQFIDAQTSDDSTNNRTKVELLKELANASDLASQPDGLYLVEDSTPMPGISANIVSYSNTTSGLTADDVQEAVDEVASEKIDKTAVSSIETTNTAVAAHAINTYFINSSGQLVKATSAIAIGNTISESNTTVTTVTDTLESANNAITQLNNDIDIKDTVLSTDKSLYLQREVLNVTNHTGYIRDKLIGGSVAWNQLVQNGNFATGDLTNWAGAATTSVSNNTITVTSSGVDDIFIYQNLETRVVPSHKYIIAVTGYSNRDHSTSRQGGIEVYLGEAGAKCEVKFDTIKRTYYIVGAATSEISFATYRLYSYDDVVSYFSNIQCIDLTLAFGAVIADYIYNLELTTAGSGIEWLKSQGFLTKSYYDYSTGSLISVKPESKKVIGKNLLSYPYYDGSSKTSGTITYTVDEDGVVSANGNTSSGTYYDFINASTGAKLYEYGLKIGHTYTLTGGIANKAYMYGTIRDSSNNTIMNIANNNSDLSTTFTIPNNAYSIHLGLTVYADVSNEKVYPMIRLASIVDSTYEPYHETIYQFDNSKEYRGIPLLDSNNNLYYDGDIYESNGKVTRKYGIVDLGTLNWGYEDYTVGARFSSPSIEDLIKKPSINEYYLGLFSSRFTADPDPINDITTSKDRIIAKYTNGLLYVIDKSYTDAATFKAAMSGVYLVYELATPTTEYVTPFADPMSLINATIEEYEDNRFMPVPPGHETQYMGLSDKPYSLPSIPRSNGKWLLGCDVSNGEAKFDMVADVTRELTEKLNHAIEINATAVELTADMMQELDVANSGDKMVIPIINSGTVDRTQAIAGYNVNNYKVWVKSKVTQTVVVNLIHIRQATIIPNPS